MRIEIYIYINCGHKMLIFDQTTIKRN